MAIVNYLEEEKRVKALKESAKLQEIGRELQLTDFTNVDGLLRLDSNISRFAYRFYEDNKNSLIELQRKQFIFYDEMTNQLASNYRINIPSGYYGLHFRYLSEEFAKLVLDIEVRNDDFIFELVRDQLLYQNVGYLMGDRGGFSPYYIHYRNNSEFRRLLLAIANVLLHGSRTESIKSGLQLFTHNKIELQELYALPNAEVWQRFMWRILVIIGDDITGTINMDSARKNLERLTRVIKPAHTLLDIGFVWGEDFYFTAGCSDVIDLDSGQPITQNIYKRFEFDYGENLRFDKLMEDPYCLMDGYPVGAPRGDNAPWHVRRGNARITACEDYMMFINTRYSEVITRNDMTEECISSMTTFNEETFNSVTNVIDEVTAIQKFPMQYINPEPETLYDIIFMDSPNIRLDYPLEITMTGDKLENRAEN